MGSRAALHVSEEKNLVAHGCTEPPMYKNCFGIMSSKYNCTAISKLSVENGGGELKGNKMLPFF